MVWTESFQTILLLAGAIFGRDDQHGRCARAQQGLVAEIGEAQDKAAAGQQIAGAIGGLREALQRAYRQQPLAERAGRWRAG